MVFPELCVHPDKKTIKPINVGGLAGGLKYVCQNIFFKFALDVQVHLSRPIIRLREERMTVRRRVRDRQTETDRDTDTDRRQRQTQMEMETETVFFVSVSSSNGHRSTRSLAGCTEARKVLTRRR